MSTDRCGCLRRWDIFVSVVLALTAHSILWGLVALILLWFSAKPTVALRQPSVRPYVVSPCQRMSLSTSTDGTIELNCQW